MEDFCFARLKTFMGLATNQANLAIKKNAIPVGAIIVFNNKVISAEHNSTNISIMHAELLCIQNAMKKLQKKYLTDCEIFITHEPCEMCYQAIINSRIESVFFGSYSNFLFEKRNKIKNYYGNILMQESQRILSDFFIKKRKKNTVDLLKI